MFKLPITYTDYNGIQNTEVFYFNLSLAEVAEMEMTMPGGLSDNLTRIGESNNPQLIMKTFKEIILGSYGVKSEDGKRFLKTPEVVQDFVSSEAYAVLFMKLVTDAEFAAIFVRGIIPTKDDPTAQQFSRPQLQDHQAPSVEPARPTIQDDEAESFFRHYNWIHEKLQSKGVEHTFLDKPYFLNVPRANQQALIEDLQMKIPEIAGDVIPEA